MRVHATALPGKGVPDTEALRRAALRASWARDRRVGRRRLIWRWFLWFLLRGVLPVLALVSVLALAWVLMQSPQADAPPASSQASPATLPSLPASAGAAGADPPALPPPALRLDLSTPPDDPAGRAGPGHLPHNTSGDPRP